MKVRNQPKLRRVASVHELFPGLSGHYFLTVSRSHNSGGVFEHDVMSCATWFSFWNFFLIVQVIKQLFPVVWKYDILVTHMLGKLQVWRIWRCSRYWGKPTGTCFIQKIYAPSSSLLQGKHLPFTPSPLRLNIFRLFVILSLTQLFRFPPQIFSFLTSPIKFKTPPPPLRRIGQEYSAKVAFSIFQSMKRIQSHPVRSKLI